MSVTTLDFDTEYANITARLQEDYNQRLRQPYVRIWDGSWVLRGVAAVFYSAEFHEIDSETGMGQITMPANYYISQWIADEDHRTTLNVHITVDKDGVRWSGRMDHYSYQVRTDGTEAFTVYFKHDYENLKHILVWANPFLPGEVQFPRVWILFGPARWVCKTTLFVNLWRLETSAWMIPDDPLNLSSWLAPLNFLDQSQWSMVLAPGDAGSDNSPFAIIDARFKDFHSVCSPTFEDAQLTPTFRRWLTGDPPAWSGANLRNGCLVIDIVDKSGWTSGTSFFGDIFSGLVYAIAQFTTDGFDDGTTVIADPAFPSTYSQPGFKGVHPSVPSIVYRSGPYSTIKTSEFNGYPPTDAQHVTGGHSMPGVNELISAAIQMAGDMIAAIVGVPPVGGTTDAILKPLYCVGGDTLIDGPDGKERIDTLAKRGGPFKVWSVTPEGRCVGATAGFAFKKGSAELFEYTLANGYKLTATKDHRWLTRSGWVSAGKCSMGTGVAVLRSTSDEIASNLEMDDLPDSAWGDLSASSSLEFSKLVSVKSVGVQNFYDLYVPGFVNYVGNGIVSHNTDVFLAFMSWKDINRANACGWSHYRERFAQGADKAYTLSAVIALRTSLWATRNTHTHKLTVNDGAPWIIGQQGFGQFYVGDRIGSTSKMMPGKIFVDRVSEIELKWDRKTPPSWDITIGQRKPFDPVLKAFQRIQAIMGAIHDLGVW